LLETSANKSFNSPSPGWCNGPASTIVDFDTPEEEIQAVSQWIAERVSEGIIPNALGVFVRSDTELDKGRAAVSDAGIPFETLDENTETISGRISMSTMRLTKGLEFRAVSVMACGDEVIPLQDRIEAIADESDLEEVYNTERHLLDIYIACA
jgi:superfamily I DNA/RNA helicase